MHFLQKAQDKNILELEGIEYQFNLFDNMSEELQVEFLINTLEENSFADEIMLKIIKAWKAGDSDSLAEVLNLDNLETELDKKLINLLIINRNYTMADTIEGYIKKGGSYFVIVGAGHLAGQESIVNILSKKGYEVSQLIE